jgi:hypothetical protein
VERCLACEAEGVATGVCFLHARSGARAPHKSQSAAKRRACGLASERPSEVAAPRPRKRGNAPPFTFHLSLFTFCQFCLSALAGSMPVARRAGR